jgi:hypothetical protein
VQQVQNTTIDYLVKLYFVYPNKLVNHYLRAIVVDVRVMILRAIARVKRRADTGLFSFVGNCG